MNTNKKSSPVEIVQAEKFKFELSRKRVKNINMRLAKDGRIAVSAPRRVPLSVIKAFVDSKAEWVLQAREALLQTSENLAPAITEGAEHYLWGNKYPLKLSHSRSTRCALVDDQLCLSHPLTQPNDLALIKALDNWYRPQIKAVIPALIEKWQSIIGVEVREWGVKKMRTKWGTCNIQDARIWLNLELVKYPVECLEYVVVHELTHLHERYHNRRFYALMSSYLPDWRARELKLEKFFNP